MEGASRLSPDSNQITTRPFSLGVDLRAWHTAFFCAVVLTCVMLWALPKHIQGGDAGEFATVLLRGGVPHPSGYPWMRGLGFLARGLETGGIGPASAAAAVPAALAVAGWTVLAWLLGQHVRPGLAAVAVLVPAVSSLAVVHGFDCEVWGPLLLFCAVVLSASLAKAPRPFVCGLWLGLATSHHLTASLLLPVVATAVWRPGASAREQARRLLTSALGGVVGLSTFATLALGSAGAWRWGDTLQLDGWTAHVLRLDYGMFELGLHQANPAVLDLWSRTATSLASALTGVPIPSAVAAALVLALVGLSARRPETIAVRCWWGLYVAIGLTTLGFPALHNIEPNTPFARWILERFDLLPLLLWTLPFAMALQRLAGDIGWRRQLVLAGVGLLATLQLVRSRAHGWPRDEAGVEHYARDLLATPTAPQSVVFGTDDHRTFPVLYAQSVLDLGEHVLYVDAQLLTHAWYRQWLQQRWPAFPDRDKPLRAIGELWTQESTRDVPIYLANVFSRPAHTKLKLVPEGILWRVVPPHASADEFSPARITERHLDAFSRYGARAGHFAGLVHPATHPWSGDLWYAYRDTSASLATWHERAGRRTQAQAVRAAFRRLSGEIAESGSPAVSTAPGSLPPDRPNGASVSDARPPPPDR